MTHVNYNIIRYQIWPKISTRGSMSSSLPRLSISTDCGWSTDFGIIVQNEYKIMAPNLIQISNSEGELATWTYRVSAFGLQLLWSLYLLQINYNNTRTTRSSGSYFGGSSPGKICQSLCTLKNQRACTRLFSFFFQNFPTSQSFVTNPHSCATPRRIQNRKSIRQAYQKKSKMANCTCSSSGKRENETTVELSSISLFFLVVEFQTVYYTRRRSGEKIIKSFNRTDGEGVEIRKTRRFCHAREEAAVGNFDSV